MKILYVSEYFYPRPAGGEIVSWQYCKGLARHGHKMYVITSRLQDTAEYEVVDGVEIFRPLQSASLSGNGGISGIAASFKRVMFAIKLYPILKRFCAAHAIDLIYDVAYVPSFAACRSASNLGVPIITAVHSICGTTWFRLTNPIMALLNYMMEIFVIRFERHTVIHCPSNYAADRVRFHTRSKIVVIPPPVDTQEIAAISSTTDTMLVRQGLGIGQGQQLLLFVGSLTPVKNPRELIASLSNLKTDFRLALVGEGTERSKIVAKIKKLKMSDKVLLLGQWSHMDTLRLIYSCDVLLLPSKTETFGIVVIEALALNRPVIATPVGCVPDISSTNMYVIRNMDEIKKIIESGLVPHTSHDAVERFELSTVIGRLEQLCKTTIGSGHNTNITSLNGEHQGLM